MTDRFREKRTFSFVTELATATRAPDTGGRWAKPLGGMKRIFIASIVICAAMQLAHSNTSTSVQIDTVGVPTHVTNDLVGWYLQVIPEERRRGSISIMKCTDSIADFDCDYSVEHHYDSCVERFSTIEDCDEEKCWQRPIPESRTRDCTISCGQAMGCNCR